MFGTGEIGLVSSIGTIVYKSAQCKDYSIKSDDKYDGETELDSVLDGLFEEESSFDDILADIMTVFNRLGPIKTLAGIALAISLIICCCPACCKCCKSD